MGNGYSKERQQENEFINKLRAAVGKWRYNDYPYIKKISKELLYYWQGKNELRENKLFFCQIEALETLIYLNEAAEKFDNDYFIKQLKSFAKDNLGLYRLAFKMATGSGKTIVMAMMIAYNAINKDYDNQDKRFADTFVIITPGITIKDRLAVLQPNHENNYYRQRDIVPNQYWSSINRAIIQITNFHNLELRSKYKEKIIREEARVESGDAMVRRAFKSILGKSRIVVFNDEAHHCYQPKISDETKKATSEEMDNNQDAGVWLSGLQHLSKRIKINMVIDLSATPYFLSGSGYPEGKMFGWVCYDFSLLDAIESGIIKIPRLVIDADNRIKGEEPQFKNLWVHIKDDLPKKGKKEGGKNYAEDGRLPTLLHSSLEALYGHYEKRHTAYEQQKKSFPDVMPPVMIVVCNNTTVAELVYRWIAGYEKPNGNIEKGNLEIFRNEDGHQFLSKRNTLIIDSYQLERNKIGDDFKKAFDKEIQEFRSDYQKSKTNKDITDAMVLREVMNTVGKKGKLGENIKCVVSVSMLTEGWDVNSVTHILGVRAFSTQLLCEQVIGRALRRQNYVIDSNGLFTAEYAEVYGVPFDFLRATSEFIATNPKPIHRVYAMTERSQYQIQFPRLAGYHRHINEENLSAHFTDESKLVIEGEATMVITRGIIGDSRVDDMERIKNRREGEVITTLTNELLKTYFKTADGGNKYWLTNQLSKIVQQWLSQCLILKDNQPLGYVVVGDYLAKAITKIHNAISTDPKTIEEIKSIMVEFDLIGSTRHVNFNTTKNVMPTTKCHINYVVADTDQWEQMLANKLERMENVLRYVKNERLDFKIPYYYQTETHSYYPDFIAVIKLPKGDELNLILETTGEDDDKKRTKVAFAKNWWCPAVNNSGQNGRWEFLEIKDPHNAQNEINNFITNLPPLTKGEK